MLSININGTVTECKNNNAAMTLLKKAKADHLQYPYYTAVKDLKKYRDILANRYSGSRAMHKSQTYIDSYLKANPLPADPGPLKISIVSI